MSAYGRAVDRLRVILNAGRTGRDAEVAGIIAARDPVLAQYRPVFSRERIPFLTAEEFRGFLRFSSNRHWKSIHRQGPTLTRDMDVLRDTLAHLLDETLSISERINAVVSSGGSAKLMGLGKAVATPILFVAHPDRYGVWNDPVEESMQELGIWPLKQRGMSMGQQYERINALLLQLSEDLGIDLWTLDALWWGADGVADITVTEEEFEETTRELHEFDEARPLDDRREVLIRKEQGFIRQQLLKDAAAVCTICRRSFPRELMRAAHLKRRSDCSLEEKRDYRSNVLPMCTFGCDELFERGYVIVRHGRVTRGRPIHFTPVVQDYLHAIIDMPCVAYYGESGRYFDWHADSHLPVI